MRHWLVATLALITIACTSQPGPAPGKPDSGIYAYIPADATLIAGARLNGLRASPIYKHLRDRMPAQARPYEKEASEIVFSSDGKRGLVLARGKFDRQRIERDLTEANSKANETVEFLAPDLIAIGDKQIMESAKRKAGSALAAQIPAMAEVWLVTNGRIEAQFPERSNLGNLNRIVQDLRLGVLGFRATDAIQADAFFDFANEPASEQAQTAVRGFIGLARLSTPSGQEQLLEVLDRVFVSRDKARVTMKADWQPSLVQTIIDALPANRPASR